MAKPTDDITWASDATYSAGADPWSGQPNAVEPVSGRKSQGWEPKKKPGAPQLNWWQRGVARWVAWFSALFTDGGSLLELVPFLAAINAVTTKRSRLPVPAAATNWTFGSNQTTYADASIQCSAGSNFAMIDLDIPIGHVLKNFTLTAKKATGASTQSLTCLLVRNQTAAVAEKTLYTSPITAITTVSVDYLFNLVASTHISMDCQTTATDIPGVHYTVTFTRTTGSFITDGFVTGQTIDASGWSIAEHNFSNGAITSLAALTMSVSVPGVSSSLTLEHTNALVEATPVSIPAGGGNLYLIVEATASGAYDAAIANLAYEHSHPAITY